MMDPISRLRASTNTTARSISIKRRPHGRAGGTKRNEIHHSFVGHFSFGARAVCGGGNLGVQKRRWGRNLLGSQPGRELSETGKIAGTHSRACNSCSKEPGRGGHRDTSAAPG